MEILYYAAIAIFIIWALSLFWCIYDALTTPVWVPDDDKDNPVYSIPPGLSSDGMIEYIAYRSIKDNKEDGEEITEKDYNNYGDITNRLKISSRKGDIENLKKEISELEEKNNKS